MNASLALRDTPHKCLAALRRFWFSPLFFVVLTLFCFTFTALRLELAGAISLVLLILVILVTAEDVFATTFPFLMLTVLVSSCYDSFALFSPYWWLAIPAVAALLFHFIYYRLPYSTGAGFPTLLAVSLATALGGIGCLSATEYFNPVTLYYVLGLGFGMVGIYLLLRAEVLRPRKYDVKRLLLVCLYLVGVYAAFFTLLFYLRRIPRMQQEFLRLGHLRLQNITNRNVYSTFLLFALPVPFYYALKKNGWHLLSALFFLIALCLTSSRGGMVMGILLFFICSLSYLRRDTAHRRRNAVLLAGLILTALLGMGFLIKFYSYRFAGGFIKGDEPRVLLLPRAVKDFLSHPFFGVGLGYRGNADIYNPKTFAMNWYHMMIPQIVAGLGLFGTVCYACLFYRRYKLAKANGDALCRTLSLSYLGLFLMTQVNPGEFCPLPFAFLAVFIFLLLEVNFENTAAEKKAATETALLTLLGNALFQKSEELPKDTDMAAVFELAKSHMVFGVATEGLAPLPPDTVPADLLTEWQDMTVTLIYQNGRLAAVRRLLVDYCRENGIPTIILKGDSAAALYPTPDLRVTGDIDCLLGESDIPAVADFLSEQGFKAAEKEGDHHVALKKGPITVELHRTPAGLPDGAMGEVVSAYLKDTLDTAKTAPVLGDTVPVPDDFHQALILLLHIQQHMREGGVGLRQISDFALFLHKGLREETRPRLTKALDEIGLLRFAETLSLALVRHLSLPAKANPFEGGDPHMADALFADFLQSGNFGKGDKDYEGSALLTLNGDGKHPLKAALSGLAEKCKQKWPLSRKVPLLLSVLIPYFVLHRLITRGTVRPTMLKSAAKRATLYHDLELFNVNKD